MSNTDLHAMIALRALEVKLAKSRELVEAYREVDDWVDHDHTCRAHTFMQRGNVPRDCNCGLTAARTRVADLEWGNE